MQPQNSKRRRIFGSAVERLWSVADVAERTKPCNDNLYAIAG